MIALMAKMVICLIIALLLGGVIGWLLGRTLRIQKHEEECDVLSRTIENRNDYIIKLEQEYDDEKIINVELREQVEQKTEALSKQLNELAYLEETLERANQKLKERVDSEHDNQHALESKIEYLQQSFKEKEKEVQELETVLIKAEETIEKKHNLFIQTDHQLERLRANKEGMSENDRISSLEQKIEELVRINRHQEESIRDYQDTIEQLEQELKLYHVDDEADEFIISKDQFRNIEEQLIKYQKEIKAFKDEQRNLSGEKGIGETVSAKSKSSDMDDIAIVKLFRDTYKKITKS